MSLHNIYPIEHGERWIKIHNSTLTCEHRGGCQNAATWSFHSRGRMLCEQHYQQMLADEATRHEHPDAN